jgi:hypothetical protein
MFSSFKNYSRRVIKSLLLIASLMLIGATSGDAIRFSPAQEVAAPYSYDIISWHFENFLSKWTHRVSRFMPWNGLTEIERQAMVSEYFDLTPRLRELQDQIKIVSAESQNDVDSTLEGLESELKAVMKRRLELRPDVEEALESAISAVAKDQRLGAIGALVFPPVDIRLTEPPKVLITSPRDRIERTQDVLIDPHVRVEDREAIESILLETENISALVLDIGGVATFPASLYSGGDIKGTLSIAAHEWLHHYLFFKPLGQHMFKSSEMQVLNETLADLAGKEIGALALGNFTFATAALGSNIPVNYMPENQDEETSIIEEFSFSRAMRETRAQVDELLALGEIEQAEAYMEERRQVFVANGFNIRKLNQAYFAFNGTYADSAASVSPIADQLKRYRNAVPDVGTFVREVGRFSTYQKFLDGLSAIENLTTETTVTR